ncbi:MAG: N-formylglutamate amidohydrolase [Gemmatimonadota bacterium]|nr:N-formylglutamate amidohydrolase [Gemmatimonadota bacterium]
MLRSPLLLHIPHASTRIPDDAFGDFVVDRDTLDAELLRLTDRFTDALYGDGFPSAQIVAADVSRLVVDVERFADDAHEPCAVHGMGAVYVRTSSGAPLRAISETRRAQLMNEYYWPHHQRLDAMAARALEQFGRCVIIDAHSFPVVPMPTQVDVGDPPEIGIGTDAMHTSAELAEVVHTFFTDRGFRVGVNRPFAGALVPNAYYGLDRRVQSVMIEVRRDPYMDERTGERLPGFADVQRVLTEFRALLETWSLARGSNA